MNVNEKMVMVFDNKNIVSLVGSSELLKKEKARKISYVSLKKSFIVFYVFFCVPYRGGRLKLIV